MLVEGVRYKCFRGGHPLRGKAARYLIFCIYFILVSNTTAIVNAFGCESFDMGSDAKPASYMRVDMSELGRARRVAVSP